MEPIDLLVTLDENYLPPLRVLLASLRVNGRGEGYNLFLLHSGFSPAALEGLGRFCAALDIALSPCRVDGSLFARAPVTAQYPREMYYRLLAHRLLPERVRRVLYLDPDILAINPVRPLWETDLRGNLFAAAPHTWATDLMHDVNQVRLGTESKYYNTGVLLMDLDACRKEVRPEAVFQYVEDHGQELLLPDQDVFNALYGSRTLALDDALWNYDARRFNTYLLRSGGAYGLDWVLSHTALLHFCGKSKPWQPSYRHRFGILYKHYQHMARRAEK